MGSAELMCPRYATKNDFITILKYHTDSEVSQDKMCALLMAHQDNNAKLATDEKIREVKIRRSDTYIGTWNVHFTYSTRRKKNKITNV